MLNTRKKIYSSSKPSPLELANEVNQPVKKTPLDHYLDISNNQSFRSNTYGKSKYDKDLNLETEVNLDDVEGSIKENRAQTQSWGAKASAGVARAGVKAGIEIAKLVPTVVGGVAALGQWAIGNSDGNGWETAFNNAGHKALNALNEDINNELLPVYVKKAVSEGNLWDNLTSIDFYATEGADGLGFMLSMFAPGAALKALGGANKFKSLMGGFRAGKEFMSGTSMMNKAANLGLKADEIGITFANTFAEAAAESGSQMEAFRNTKPNWIKENTFKIQQELKTGKISSEQAKTKIANLDNDFEQQVGSIGKESFWMNMGLLAVTNFANTKMLGLAGESTTKTVGKQALRDIDGNIVKSVASRTLIDRAKDIPLKAGKMFLNEGFVEEGTQSTIENYLSGKAKKNELTGGFKDFNLKEFGEEYADMVTTTEGQKAIALGGILGYGSVAARSAKQLALGRTITDPETGLPTKVRQTDDDLEISRVNRLLAKGVEAEAHFAQINPDIYKKTDKINPETGENEYELVNGKKVIDPVKRDALLTNIKITEDDSKLWDQAIKDGDTDTIKHLQQVAENRLVNSFIADSQDGLNILSEYLKDSVLPEDRKKSIMEKATVTQKAHEQFISYAQPVLDLKNKDATPEDLQKFYNTLVNTNKMNIMKQFEASKALDLHNKKIDDLLSQHGLDRTNLENQKLRSQLATKDIRFAKEQELESYYKSTLEDIKQTNLDLWNPKKQQEAFDKIVNNNKTTRDNNSAENVANADAITEAIQSAQTIDEIDESVNNTAVDPQTAEVINQLANDKKAEIVAEDKQAVAVNNENVKNEIEEFITNTDNLPEGFIFDGENYYDYLNDVAYTKDEYSEEIKKRNGIETKEEIPVDINESKQEDLTDLVNEDIVENKIIEEPIELQNIAKGDKPQFPGVATMGVDRSGNTYGKFSQYILEPFRNFINNFKSVKDTVVTFTKPFYLNDSNKIALKYLDAKYVNYTSEQLDFMYRHLPLQVNVDENIFTFIASLSDQTTPDMITYQARKLIVDAIIKHGYENVTSKIQYQKGGELKYLPADNENKILSLKEFDNDLSKVKLFWVQDVDGNVINENNVQADKKSEFPFALKNPFKQKGYVYTIIHSPGGIATPVKLNVRKVTTEQAEMIYRVYEALYNYNQNPEGGIRLGQNNAKLSDLYKVDLSLKTLIEQDFETEFKLFKNGDQTSIGNFMTLFIHDNVTYEGETKPYTTKYQGGEIITGQEGVLSFEGGKMSKELFLEFLTTKKRQNTKIEYLTSDVVDNNKYKKYLLEQVISVNIDTQKPFDGDINVYIDSNVTVIEKLKVQSEIEAKKVDIERRRQEELNSESYRVPDSKETRTWTDDDGVKFETTITTFKDGSKQATNKNLETQLRTPISKYNKDLSNEKIYEVEASNAIERGEIQQQEVKSAKIVDKINAKYDAELTALKQPITTQEKAQQADIERRRQEELKERVVYDRRPTVEDGEFKIIGDPNNRIYRVNENTGRPQVLDESNGLWSNTEESPNLFFEIVTRSGFQKSKDKINAKYDAELKALESNQTTLENNTENTLISDNVSVSLDESYKTEAVNISEFEEPLSTELNEAETECP